MESTSTSPNMSKHYKCQYGRVELLRADNYPLWSSTLTYFLKADRTWKIVQGIERAPTPPASAGPSNRNRSRPRRQNQNPSYRSSEAQDNDESVDDYDEQLEKFESKSAKACSMISSAVEDSYKQFIYAKSDPKDMWDTLKSQLDSTNSDVGPFVLQSQFRQEKHENGPIAVFLAKLQEYQTRLVATDYQHCPGADSLKPLSMRKFAKTSAIPSNLPPQQWLGMPEKAILKGKNVTLGRMTTLGNKETVMTILILIRTARARSTRSPRSIGTRIRTRYQMTRLSSATIALRKATKSPNAASRRRPTVYA
jgi:hypothetical protein